MEQKIKDETISLDGEELEMVKRICAETNETPQKMLNRILTDEYYEQQRILENLDPEDKNFVLSIRRIMDAGMEKIFSHVEKHSAKTEG